MHMYKREFDMQIKIPFRTGFVSLFIFILLVSGFTQPVPVGTTSLQFLKIEASARAAGMSGAYVSAASGSDGVFWNPNIVSELAVSMGLTPACFSG